MTRHVGIRRSTASDDHITRRTLTGVARDGATEGGLRRGLALRGAGGVAHLTGQAEAAGVDRARRKRARGGGRSSGEMRARARGHRKASWGVLRLVETV